jgi:hypothetical protein
VRAVRDAVVCYDEQIETLAREHPDFAIIDSLPGVGPALAPRLSQYVRRYSLRCQRIAVLPRGSDMFAQNVLEA